MTRPSIITLLAALLGVCFALSSGPAVAKNKKKKSSSKTTIKRAKWHERQGKQFLKAKRYQEAIVELQASHALRPRAKHLYNIALAYVYMQDSANAIVYFKKYLRAAPKGRGAPQARAQIKRLKADLAKRRADAAAASTAKADAKANAATTATATDADKGAASNTGAAPSRPDLVDTSKSTKQADPKPKKKHKKKSSRSWAWVATGAAIIAAGIAADTIPERNGKFDATDLVPVGLYGLGATVVFSGAF